MTDQQDLPAPAGVAALEISNLSKSFNGTAVLSNVDLSIASGEIHGLVGENGSGKSTVIKVLSGYHRPDDGAAVRINGVPLPFGSADHAYQLGLRVVHQDLGLLAGCSVADNLSFNAGFSRRWGTVRSKDELRRAEVDLARVGVEIDPRVFVSSLTPAVRTGVAVARALRHDAAAPAHLLVLDEPTATLPVDDVQQLLEIVRTVADQGVGVLYVTHRLGELFEISHRISVLRDGRLVATEPADALDRRTLVGLLVGKKFDELATSAAPGPALAEDPVLQVRHLAAGALRDFSLSVYSGQVLGIAGITGSGRESLLPAVFGGVERTGGTVHIDGAPVPSFRPPRSIAAGMVYLPPDRKVSGGFMNLSARENLTVADLQSFWRRLRLNKVIERATVDDWFQRLDVRPSDGVDRPLSTFSGGNQQKILFAKWLRCQPRILLLDEPTQGVDIPAKALIHRLILESAAGGATVIVSSADLEELVALCSRVMVLRDGVCAAEVADRSLTVQALTRISVGEEDLVK